MKYEYEILSPGERQYDEYDLYETTRVPAKYVKSDFSLDNGNPYIEALPAPRTLKEVYRDYTKPLSDFDREKIKRMDEVQRQISVMSLRSIRYMLPFHHELETEFFSALVLSYRNRKPVFYTYGDKLCTEYDQEKPINVALSGKIAAAANAGCTLLGYSGCGKSSALEILLSNYPQVIEHRNEKYPRFTQIVYLVVVCPANSNFAALYNSIGACIDTALGNSNPIYEKLISKERTLGEKARVVCRLIDLFGIGCIIFDEIQLIDFDGHRENTFESLLTIVNQTKVALMAIGTEDAYGKMFPNIRTSRRTGTLIKAHQYCENKDYFSSIVKNLMNYQWIDQPIEYTQDIANAFYDVTKGIVDQLISIYMYTQIDYLRYGNGCKIDGDYIRKVSKRYFPEMQNLLAHLGDSKKEKERQLLTQKAQGELIAELQAQRQNEIAKQCSQVLNSNTEDERILIRSNVIRDLTKTVEISGKVYNHSKIERAVDHVMKLKNNARCTEDELAAKAYKWLMGTESDKRNTPKSKSKMDTPHIEIRDLLEACTYSPKA